MSETTVTPVAAPITLDSSNSKAPVAAPPGVPSVSPDEKPSWLDARLERERKSLLKELGLDSLEDGKKAISALKAKEDAEKSAAQKAAELEASFKSTKAEKDELASALSVYAKTQLASLTEAQRNAVAAVAGDNSALTLKTIEALKPTWAASAAAPAATAPVVETPKDTAAAPSMPKDAGTSQSPPDLKAVHAELQKTNPVLAARFALANGLFDNK